MRSRRQQCREDVSNVAADDLGADENLLGNESLGNEADANAGGDDVAPATTPATANSLATPAEVSLG